MSKEPMIISSVTFRFYWNMLFAVLILLLFTHCNQKRNEAETARLIVLDSMLNEQPEAVLDSLSAIKTAKRSKFNRGYAALLQTIAEDKTFFNFTSDSLISASQQQLSKHKRTHLDLHARALMYQGLVRHRMGVNDSTAYMPLKDAAIEFNKISPLPLRNCYLVNYYLGQIHDKNDNTTLSSSYLEKALPLAKQLNDSSYLFATYRQLFWNKMQIPNYSKAKLYLDTVQQFKIKNRPDLIAFYNMQSVYYEKTSDHPKALEAQKALINLKQAHNIPLERSNYYNLSGIYQQLEQLDSAYRYIQLTIEHIRDTSFHLNHLYYKDLAAIAADLGKWSESSAAYQKSYELLDKATDKIRDTKLAELEKKYDKTEAENRALRAEKGADQKKLIIVFVLFGALIFASYAYWLKKQKELTQERNVVLKKDKELAQEQRLVLEKENELIEQRNTILEKERKLAAEEISLAREKQNRLEDDKLRVEQQLNNNRLVLAVLFRMSQDAQKMKDRLYTLKINTEFKKQMPTLHIDVEKDYEYYNKKAIILDPGFISEETLCHYLRLSEADADKLNRSDKLLLMLTDMGANSKDIALLFNTTSNSIRARKVALRKKIESLNLHFPEDIANKFEL